MNKKTILSLTVIMLMISWLSGCSSDETGSVNNNDKQTEVMQALDETVTSTKEEEGANTANEDLAEMRHWKYGVNGPAANQSAGSGSENQLDISASSIASSASTAEQLSASYQSEVVTIQLLTEDEMDAIINKLLSLGYLGSKTVSESEFKEALKKFQADNKLAASGVLDSPTLSLLKTE